MNPLLQLENELRKIQGPGLGRAIVYKLQVDAHIDGLDDDPTAIFNIGSFKRGKLNLPDLGLILE